MDTCNVPMTPEARWKHLYENGQKELVSLDSNEAIENKPHWFDEGRFVKARQAIQKHFIGLVDLLQLLSNRMKVSAN